MVKMIALTGFITLSITCLILLYKYQHNALKCLYALALWIAGVGFYIAICDQKKNTLHVYPCEQCIYETKIAKLPNGAVMPVEIWVGCKNEQCEFKNSR